MKISRTLCFLASILGCTLGSSGQQATGCQRQDFVGLGQQIAAFRVTVLGKGFSQDQIDSLVQGYQDTLLTSKASSCNQAAVQPAPTDSRAAVPDAQAPPAPQPIAKRVKTPLKSPGGTTGSASAHTSVAGDPPAAAVHGNPQDNVASRNPTPDGANGNPPPAAGNGNPPPPCPPNIVDMNVAVPALNTVEVSSNASVTGELPKGTDLPKGTTGTVQVCVTSGSSKTYKPLGTPVNLGADGTFSVTGVKPAIAVSAGDQVVAQLIEFPGNKVGPASDAVTVGRCSNDPIISTMSTLELIDSINSGDSSVKLTTGDGLIRVCVNDLPASDIESETTPSSGTGKVAALKKGLRLEPGDVVVVQTVSAVHSPTYGPLSNEVSVGPCSKIGNGDSAPRPAVTTPSAGNQTVRGSVSVTNGKLSAVRICVDDRQKAVAPVDENGNFNAALFDPLKAGENVTAQAITSEPDAFNRTYGLPSDPQQVPGLRYHSLFGSFIGGFEQSGYSSEITNTNAFVSAYIRGGFVGNGAMTGATAIWGRIRLLSAPAPSTKNIVSVIANPTGQITESSFSNVGQVIDYSLGSETRLKQWDLSNGQTRRISLIAGFGNTTPLTANTPVITYLAPAPNTPDCQQLISRYPPSAGVAGLYPDPTNKNCIINPVTKAAYKYVSFTNQDRSNFLFKYGGGFRFTHVYPAKGQGSPYDGMLDLTFGQDQTIMGGKLHGVAFKIDSQYPLAFGSASFIYLFGSATLRLGGNQNYPPLILATPTSGVPMLPDPSITVLSLQQPNRDFYRFGAGINILDMFSKLKGSTPASATDTTTPATNTSGGAPSKGTSTAAKKKPS